MIRLNLIAAGVVAVVLLILASSALFIVPQNQQALVLQFGEPRRVVRDPGLKVKVPFLQNVLYYERRLIEADTPSQQVTMADQKRIEVDAYARYRIVEPLDFYKSVNNELTAGDRIKQIINSSIRRVLGSTTLASILSPEREKIMADIEREVADAVKRFGIEVIDVRLRRADLPDTTSAAIYNRMRSEREREAREFRAQGQEQAQQITSRADREKVVLLAEAQREAQSIRGEGDAQAIKIYADAFGQDPAFFSFYRSMQAYREALPGDTTMVLSPDSDFFRYFADPKGKLPGPRASAPAK